MNRRDFIKILGGAMATSAVAMSCSKVENQQQTEDIIDGIGAMTMRQNPNTGDKVSILGFGMMRLPVLAGGTARENPDSPIDQDMVNLQVDYALEHGVNYFDTSPAYCQGKSEQSTGIALLRHPRNTYYIATKLSNFNPATWSLKSSQEMFENSLRELRTDYVDYLLMHGTGMGSENLNGMDTFYARYVNNGLLDWLVEQKKAGRIRNLGFSYHGDVAVFDLLLKWHDEGRYHWDFAQIELNYLDWHYANEINARNTDADYLYDELNKRSIPAVIMEPLLGGRLANVPVDIAAKMKQREPQSSPARWAFRFAGTPQGVLTVLSGMTYMEHIKDNVQTYSPLRPVTADENAFLMDIANDIYALNAVPCTACNYCMPCPYGLNIPAIFSYYNNCINSGKMPTTDKSDPNYSAARKRFLIAYDRAVPRLRQSAHCIGCNQCAVHCPQRIDIPKQMRRIDDFVEHLKRN